MACTYGKKMLLNNLQLSDDAPPESIRVQDAFIKAIAPAHARAYGSDALYFDDAFAFPGLINSHDHLDFNSFPLLGNYCYPNYVEWGTDIHAHNKAAIEPVLRIPQALRIQWGIYKNLLNGITTVVNHGPPLPVTDELITVFQQCYCLHSIRLEKRWRLKLNHPGRNGHPFVIHVGEGTDSLAGQEIAELIRWNRLLRPLIGVHGVAMSARQATRFRALVWCPDSNFFLLGKTADIGQLKAHTTVLLGTDSTLTGSWSLWDHLRLAKATGMATDQELRDMVTTQAARVWQLPLLGLLAPGKQADLVVAKKKGATQLADRFYQLQPDDILLVMHRGEVKLFDASLLAQMKATGNLNDHFHPISLRQQQKYVKGNLPALMQQISSYHPDITFPVNYEL
jgi:cytosine/adenosine deaminase-related metal-dependent hydrolase